MNRNFPSSKRKVKCRCCGEEMLEKNYGVHLQRKHNQNNFVDKRSAGQTSIATFVKPQGSKHGNISSLPDSIDCGNVFFTSTMTVSTSEEHLTNNDAHINDVLSENSEMHPSEIEAPASDVNDKFELILQHIKKLEKEIANMKQGEISTSSNYKEDQKDEEEEQDNSTNLAYVFQSCWSISDITSFFDEFEFDDSTCTIICRTCVPNGNPLPEKKGINCPAVFVYDKENGTDFPVGCNLPNTFRCLKRHLKDHLSSNMHLKSTESKGKAEKVEEAYRRREKEVGMRIGRIAYRLYYKGRPYSDFEDEIALNVQNGCDMGDINHSIGFSKNFLTYVSDSIVCRLKKFMNERQIQTGFQPPLKIIADKATWKHRTRHFIMAVTVVPDSSQLIHAIYLGHPVIKAHSGQAVADSILSCISQWGITKEQFIGGSFDGQYFNLGVPNYLNQHFANTKENNKTFYYDWDPMHKAGLVDDHMRKKSKFSWVVTISQTITSIFNEFNFGKEYENLKDVSSQLNVQVPNGGQDKFKNPCFFSETRFANHCKKIYKNFREDFKAIITILEERQVESINGNSIQRERATNANLQMNKIFNFKFCLQLSGLCDLYDQFSKIICILQKVDILPHDRYYSFIRKVNYLKAMSSAVDLEKCPCSNSKTSEKFEDEFDQVVCFWPTYHADSASLDTVGAYQDVPLFFTEPEDLNNTRSKAKKVKTDSSASKLVVESELCDLSLHTAQELLTKVFTKDDVMIFEHIKVLTDLKHLATKIKLKGVPLTAASQTEKFLISAQKLVYDLKDVSPSELQLQYRRFLVKIEDIVKHMPAKEFKELTSMDLIKKFLSSKTALYKSIELIMHSISVASILSSVESVCESLTSIYEYHNNKRRPVSEETAHHEMMISVNGPLPTKCDSVISQAMNEYFSKQSEWHFVRRSHNLKDWAISKSVDKLIDKNSSLPFMDL